jgi:sialidase-1
MKKQQIIIGITFFVCLFSCKQAEQNPFWGEGKEFFDIQVIDSGYRAHSVNIDVAMDGTVLFGGGDPAYNAKPSKRGPKPLWRSVDGGKTFVSDSTYPINTYSSWGLQVDETNGDILKFDSRFDSAFYEKDAHSIMWRSKDNGKTWVKEIIERKKDINGWYSWEGGGETGITLNYGEKKGRLIRPTRVFVEYVNKRPVRDYAYSSAIFSDDHGRTWHASNPFPIDATGENALTELSDGRIYYNSRRHLNGINRVIAWSYDGGENWVQPEEDKVLPDGPRDTEYGLMGGLVRLPLDDYDILIYSNVDSPSGRRNSTVWASFDGGRTWPVKRLVDDGGSAYSSLAAGRNGTPSEGIIYLLKEGIGYPKEGKNCQEVKSWNNVAHNGIQVARFNLAWITQGRDWREFID